MKPFALDYHQTLLSLLDVLSEVYNKISKILGPSPFPTGQHMMGPLGLLSPHPGVSYLFTGADAAPVNDSDSSLWGIANSSNASALYAGTLGSPPPSWTSAIGDTVRQIDARLKVCGYVNSPAFDVFSCHLRALVFLLPTAENRGHAPEGVG